MGNFGGHALPGSFFIIFAVWWSIQIFRRYYASLRKGGEPFRSDVTYPCTCRLGCCGGKPFQWEGAIKIFFTTVGFTLEIITAFKDGRFTHLGNGQHATMFFFFGLSGVVDIMVHYKWALPKDIDYVMAALAFTIEALLFKFHLHGRTPLDVLLHTLLLYAVYANVAFLLVEMKWRGSVLATLARSYVVLLQGTWFWQVGAILYPLRGSAAAWDEEDHEQMMIATMMFAWHMAACFLFMLLIGGVVSCCYRRGAEKFDGVSYYQLSTSNGGSKQLSLKDDSTNILMDDQDSQDEFEQPLPKATSST